MNSTCKEAQSLRIGSLFGVSGFRGSGVSDSGFGWLNFRILECCPVLQWHSGTLPRHMYYTYLPERYYRAI